MVLPCLSGVGHSTLNRLSRDQPNLTSSLLRGLTMSYLFKPKFQLACVSVRLLAHQQARFLVINVNRPHPTVGWSPAQSQRFFIVQASRWIFATQLDIQVKE